MSRDLVNIRFKRVALVDKGANFDTETQDGAHIMLWKRDNTKKIVVEIHKEKRIMKLKEFVKSIAGLAGEPDAAKRATAAAELSAVELEIDEPPPTPQVTETEKIMKAAVASATVELAKANDELKKRLDAAEAVSTETTKLLKAERMARETGEVTILLKSFKATPFNVDEKDEKNDIAKFVKMKQTDPENYARLIDLFKAADAQLAENALFTKQVGSNHVGAGSAEAQLLAKAEALIQKSTTPLTKEAAFDQVSMDNPKLVAQYRAEQQ